MNSTAENNQITLPVKLANLDFSISSPRLQLLMWDRKHSETNCEIQFSWISIQQDVPDTALPGAAVGTSF